jgi:hypothetical protein
MLWIRRERADGREKKSVDGEKRKKKQWIYYDPILRNWCVG